MALKRVYTKKSSDKPKKVKGSPQLLPSNPAEITSSPRLEMITGLEEVEHKRMMIFINRIL